MTSQLLPPQTLSLDCVTADRDVQQRESHVDSDLVAEYAEAIRAGATFPPVVVFHDGNQYWLADGFHRVEAALQVGRSEIKVDVRQGGRREAVLFAVGANADHGARRTNADKRRAVETILGDPEWAQKTSRWIADVAKVSHPFVEKVRGSRVEESTGNVSSDVGSPLDENSELQADEQTRLSTVPLQRRARDGRLMPAVRTGARRAANDAEAAPNNAVTVESAQQAVERFATDCGALRKVATMITEHEAYKICMLARDTLIYFMKFLSTRNREEMTRRINAGGAVSPASEAADAQA